MIHTYSLSPRLPNYWAAQKSTYITMSQSSHPLRSFMPHPAATGKVHHPHQKQRLLLKLYIFNGHIYQNTTDACKKSLMGRWHCRVSAGAWNSLWGLHDQGLYSAPEDFIRLSLGFPSTALLCHSGQTDSLSAYTSIALGIFQRENDPQQLQVLLNYFWCFSDMNQCFNGNLNRDRQTHSAQGKERLGVRSHRWRDENTVD